jgi:hypothetical protein
MGAGIMNIASEFDVVDYEAGADPEVKGQECCGCRRLLRWSFYDKNSSYTSGYDPMCPLCKKAPKLSMAEHVARMREMNYNSAGTRRQRHPDQEFLYDKRPGQYLDCSLFLQKLLKAYPNLYVTTGGIKGDLALYATSGVAKPEFGGNTFKYVGYVTLGPMPEYSEYEFNERDVLQRCTQMGWRSALLRFVRSGILTEAQCDKEFGPPSGGANSLWYKKLHDFRTS